MVFDVQPESDWKIATDDGKRYLRAQPETNVEISIAYDARRFALNHARDRKASPALVRSTSLAKPSVSQGLVFIG